MKCPVIGNQIQRGKKFEICIKSVYRRYERRRERKEKNHVISVNLSDFQQIQVQEK
jgi:hypothetical protein